MADPWFLTRGSGFVLLILYTCSLVLGAVTSSMSGPFTRERLDSLQRAPMSRMLLRHLHRAVSVMCLFALVGHAGVAAASHGHDMAATAHGQSAAAAAGAVWYQWILPITVEGRLDLRWAALSVDAVLFMLVFGLCERFLPKAWWVGIHWLAYTSWGFAVTHSWSSGTDMETVWGQGVWFACLVAGVASLFVQLRTAFVSARNRKLVLEGRSEMPNQSRGHHDHLTPPQYSVLPELDDVPKP